MYDEHLLKYVSLLPFLSSDMTCREYMVPPEHEFKTRRMIKNTAIHIYAGNINLYAVLCAMGETIV